MKRVFFLLLIFPVILYSQNVPQRLENTIVIGTYNIKWLGQEEHDYNKLAKVIQNFDVCAIQEIRKQDELYKLVDELEKESKEGWSVLYNHLTARPESNYQEAHAYVYRDSKVKVNGLITSVIDTNEVYRNDPFIASFRSGNFDFTLLSIHTRWSDDSYGSRKGEVLELSNHIEWIRDDLKEDDIIVLGDFNYSGSNQYMKQFANTSNLEQVDRNEKTTFKNDYSDYSSSYDHVYIPLGMNEYVQNSSMRFDVTKYIYGDNSKSSMKKSKSELSDHLPVYAIFQTDLSDDD